MSKIKYKYNTKCTINLQKVGYIMFDVLDKGFDLQSVLFDC